MPTTSVERRIIYDRSGILATTTHLNQEAAGTFMRKADMRRDIIIVDSDTPPERDTVAVSSDTLAFRAIEPIRRLTRVNLRSKPYYTLAQEEDRFEVKIHEQQIDHMIRSGHFTDNTNYNEQFLTRLNKTTKSAILDILFQEKLGWNDQMVNYVFHFGYFSVSPLLIFILELEKDFPTFLKGHEPWLMAAGFFTANVLGNSAHNYYNAWVNALLQLRPAERSFVPPSSPARTGMGLLLPLVPVDKYLAGRWFLARHGDQLIIPR